MKHKYQDELKIMKYGYLVIIWNMLFFGFIGPFLISAESDLAVILGMIMFFVTIIGTYKFIRNRENKKLTSNKLK